MAKSKAKAKGNAKADKQNGGKKKVVSVILALVFLFACAFCGAGIGLRDKSTGKWYSTSTWYHNWGKGEKPGETGTPASGAVISEGESNGISLLCEQIPVEAYSDYGITRTSSDYYSLKVEYTPENTTFQETDITVRFKNPNSTWATGKNVNNFVSINHEDGAKTATLYILKGFGEQIIVTARSQRVPELFATATVDFICDDVTINFCNSNKTADIDTDYEVEYIHWYNGTITPDKENCIELQFKIRGGFADFMKSKGYTYTNSDQTPPSDTYSHFISYDEDIIGTGIISPRNIVIGLMGDCYYDTDNAWADACEFILNGQKPENWRGSAFIEVHVLLHSKYTHKRDDGSGYTATIGVREVDSFDLELENWAGFEVKASNVTLKPSDIVGW